MSRYSDNSNATSNALAPAARPWGSNAAAALVAMAWAATMVVMVMVWLAALAAPAQAQDVRVGDRAEVERAVWVDLGAGALGGDSTGRISASLQSDASVWTLRAAMVHQEIDGRGALTSDLSVLYGVAWRAEHFVLTTSAGVGWVRGDVVDGAGQERSVRVDRPRFHTAGAALDLQGHVLLGAGVGLGVNGFTNLNAERSMVGATVGFHVQF